MVKMLGHSPDSVDPDLFAMRSRWSEIYSQIPNLASGNQLVGSRLQDIQHKLQGVRYHRDNYIKHEDRLIEKYRHDHVPPAGVELILEEPSLVFEVEGFLWQVKSTLDMLAQLLRDVGFRSIGESFGDSGDKVMRSLDSVPAYAAVQAASLQSLITVAQTSWLAEAISMRDRIAHHGMLTEFTCFAQLPFKGGTSADLHYPTMPNGQRAKNYLDRVERELRAFVSEFVKLTLESQSGKPNE